MSGESLKIGLIAGSGHLPHTVITGAQDLGHEVIVLALQGFAKIGDFPVDGFEAGIAKFGRMIKGLKSHGCTHICFAGVVKRPDMRALKPDLHGLRHLPAALKAAPGGDDALLRFMVGRFEKAGFEVIAPQKLCAGALMERGAFGRNTPCETDFADIGKALAIAGVIGAHDIGQGAVVCNGLVLAVEAQEGTDAMLRRVMDLPEDVRGTAKARAGVLAKRLKPGQENRLDLPTIGVTTVELVAGAGLAGIVLNTGQAFVIDKPAVRAAADKAGIFIYGQNPDDA